MTTYSAKRATTRAAAYQRGQKVAAAREGTSAANHQGGGFALGGAGCAPRWAGERGDGLSVGFSQMQLCATLMAMNLLSWIGPSLLAALALTGSYMQGRRIASLEAQLVELQAAQRATGRDESAALAPP